MQFLNLFLLFQLLSINVGLSSDISSGGVSVSMDLDSTGTETETSNKHAKDYSSETEQRNSEMQHMKDPKNVQQARPSKTYVAERETVETKPNIPPFPFPARQSFYPSFN